MMMQLAIVGTARVLIAPFLAPLGFAGCNYQTIDTTIIIYHHIIHHDCRVWASCRFPSQCGRCSFCHIMRTKFPKFSKKILQFCEMRDILFSKDSQSTNLTRPSVKNLHKSVHQVCQELLIVYWLRQFLSSTRNIGRKNAGGVYFSSAAGLFKLN